MPDFTPNLNLIKPLGIENFSVSHVNGNADKVDAAFGDVTIQLEQNEKHFLYNAINIRIPLHGLSPAIGDGVTDDYPAIRAILDYASENKLNVYAPAGEYLVSNSLYLKNGVSFFGDGIEKTIISKTTHSSFTTDTITLGNTTYRIDDDSILNIQYNTSYYSIKGMTLKSKTYVHDPDNMANNSTMTKYGIYTLQTGRGTIENVETYGCKNAFYILVPWKMNFNKCQAWRSSTAFFIGYHSGGGGGTTTILNNCYALNAVNGFSINGISTVSLVQCSADTIQSTPFFVALSDNIILESCSSENSGPIILRVSNSQVTIRELHARKVLARDPNVYKTAPIHISGSHVYGQNILIQKYVNLDGTDYTDTKDLYNFSITESSGTPFNVIFDNCVLPTNAKDAYVHGDANAKSILEIIDSEGIKTTHPNIGIDKNYLSNLNRVSVRYGTSYPSSGSWKKGDIFYNISPSSDSYIGWVCITSGSPGTWKGFGTIQS